MATTATSFTPTGKPFPYIGVGVPAAQLITPIPSAEVVFTVVGGITVAAAGEDQRLLITCELPRSFCWVFVESSLNMTGVNQDDWDNAARVFFRDSVATPEIVIPISMPADGLGHETATLFSRTYLAQPSTKLMVPSAGDDCAFQLQLSNIVIDGAAGGVQFYARFLRYDRNQAQYWMVNSPVLTR